MTTTERAPAYDWAQLDEKTAIVFTTEEDGSQRDEIATATPEWAERIAEALDIVSRVES